MPIKDKSKYPDNWAEISKEQRERAGNKCELCGAVNHQPNPMTGSKVVLTVHHCEWLLNPLLNHSYPNLIVVCQRCHNRLDLGKRQRNAAATRAAKRSCADRERGVFLPRIRAKKGETVNELALFAGAGGGILGGHLLGWRTVCAVEIDPYAAAVLAARQNDGTLAPFPIWDDVRSFDGKPWRGLVDVVSGGFPCQDISAAGKGVGIDGERSGLWREMHRIIGEVRPRYALMENSPLLVGRGLTRVISDLAEIGYDAAWEVLGADDVGAPHVRKRIWILAMDRHSHGIKQDAQRKVCKPDTQSKRVCGSLADAHGIRQLQLPTPGDEARNGACNSSTDDAYPESVGCGAWGMPKRGGAEDSESPDCIRGWWTTEPDVGRVAHGVASRMDRLRAIGNGQVPLVAAVAFRILHGILRGKEGA